MTFAGVGALSSQEGHTDDSNSILSTGCANTSMSRITESYRSDTRLTYIIGSGIVDPENAENRSSARKPWL